MNLSILGYFITIPVSLSNIILLECSLDFSTSISDISIDAVVVVSLSSVHVTVKSITSPTDAARIFKKIYSKSNDGNVSTFNLDVMQFFRSVFTAVIISFSSPDSIASKSNFSSFTRKGLYLTVLPVEGKISS